MPRTAASSLSGLFRLARFHHVQTSYRDAFGRYQHVNVDALLAVLRGLEVEVSRVEDAAALLAEHEHRAWDWQLDPVSVAWNGSGSAGFRVPAGADGAIHCSLRFEDGREETWKERLEALPVSNQQHAGDGSFVERLIPLPAAPMGYHRLSVEQDGRRFESFVISAPLRAFEPAGKFWGLFCPLYALHTERSWGTGDVADLRRFASWVDAKGGDFVATLPLLPAYLEADHFSPSPYSPVSRLFWNELYADPEAAARGSGNDRALAWLQQPSTQSELARLRSSPVIDYEGVWQQKRTMLAMLTDGSAPVDAKTAEYARFRAVREKQARPWKEWPEPLRHGEITKRDYDEETFAFYARSQQLVGSQLAALSAELKARGQQFYLDLPIGADADGFDTWKYQDLFAHSMQCGAPPDVLFTGGQAWGLPPMIPARMRAGGYEYLRATLDHHLRLADILRYDHVIGLHRLYWVANGFSAREGIFVQYPAEELYAILSVESHRHQSVIVGENLGTVPQRINRAMARHGIHETYVLQYEIPLDPRRQIRPAPLRSLAGLNTHDMPTFAGFLEGRDLTIQESLGLRDHAGVVAALDERQRQVDVLCRELEERGFLASGDRDREHVFRACVAMMRSWRARYVVMNIEDYWLEEEGQNVPGTSTGNWQRRLARRIDEFPGLD